MNDLTVVPRTVQSETVDKIRDAILTGRFAPGMRLAETKLCKLMNISRPSMREALRRLEGEKLVVIVPNKGPSVVQIDWSEGAAIYEVRAMLEGEAAARFAQLVSEKGIRDLRAAVKNFAVAVADEDPLARISSTNEFYDVILAGCGNPIIGEVLQGLKARINCLRFQSMARPGRAKFSVSEFKKILKAIEGRDPVAARKAAVEHVNSAAAAARESIEHGLRESAGPNASPKRNYRARKVA